MHYKQNNKESKTFVQGLRPFGNTLPRGIKGILKKNGYNYSEIISKWNILVGKEISNWCHPKSIKMSRSDKNGTVLLSVQRGHEIDVEYSTNIILDKINSYFGYKLVNEIRLQTFNPEQKKEAKHNELNRSFKKFEKKINEIKNKDIRNLLSGFFENKKK